MWKNKGIAGRRGTLNELERKPRVLGHSWHALTVGRCHTGSLWTMLVSAQDALTAVEIRYKMAHLRANSRTTNWTHKDLPKRISQRLPFFSDAFLSPTTSISLSSLVPPSISPFVSPTTCLVQLVLPSHLDAKTKCNHRAHPMHGYSIAPTNPHYSARPKAMNALPNQPSPSWSPQCGRKKPRTSDANSKSWPKRKSLNINDYIPTIVSVHRRRRPRRPAPKRPRRVMPRLPTRPRPHL